MLSFPLHAALFGCLLLGNEFNQKYDLCWLWLDLNDNVLTFDQHFWQPEHQQLIVAGALPHLVNLLKRHRDGQSSRAVNGVVTRAADAVTNLACENSSIKSRVRLVFMSRLLGLISCAGLLIHIFFPQGSGWNSSSGWIAWICLRCVHNLSEIML